MNWDAEEPHGDLRNVINNFQQADDQPDLQGIGARQGVGGNQKLTFIGDSNFSAPKGELRYIQKSADGTTVISADTNGHGRANFQVEVEGLFDFNESDFLL